MLQRARSSSSEPSEACGGSVKSPDTCAEPSRASEGSVNNRDTRIKPSDASEGSIQVSRLLTEPSCASEGAVKSPDIDRALCSPQGLDSSVRPLTKPSHAAEGSAELSLKIFFLFSLTLPILGHMCLVDKKKKQTQTDDYLYYREDGDGRHSLASLLPSTVEGCE